ncbi:hypothetical protein [Absidia glauca]|uniref:Rhomboid-type serine protease n=1 Tax=Absidia glauca TaxID=4829 RepID=A0A163KIZ7_ABSGL|nr:hypothetical protein [Absidia glauca]
MNQHFLSKLKQKIRSSNRSNSSLMLPIQRIDSPDLTPEFHHRDEHLHLYYNRRAKEVQPMFLDHQSHRHESAITMDSEVQQVNQRVSKAENPYQDADNRKSKRYGGVLLEYKRGGLRSTIRSLLPLPISKKRESDDRIYLVSEKDRKAFDSGTESEDASFIQTPPAAFSPTCPAPSTHPPKPILSKKSTENLHSRFDTAPRRQCLPFFSYMFAIGSLVLLIYNIWVFKINYGTIISLSPFNIMLGPNTETFVQSGALFIPCMRSSQEEYQCATKNGQPVALTPPAWRYTLQSGLQGEGGTPCSIQDLCGMTPIAQDYSNQFYRFATAIAVHGGIVQWVVNMAVLLSFGVSVERRLNSLRFALTWIVSGSFGYMFAALFLDKSTALMGCFGSMNGIFGLALVNLYHMTKSDRITSTFLLKLILLIGLGMVLGYTPGRTDGRYLIWYCAYANSYEHPNEQKRLAPYDVIPDTGPPHLGGIILPRAAKVLLWPKSDEGNATPPSSILSISA